MEGRERRLTLLGVHTEEPPCDEIFLDDIHVPHTNEAYTTVHLPASAGNKGMASLQVKVDTWASRNVLPFLCYRHLYPDHVDKTGHPTGLNASKTTLTAYNGTQTPLFDHFMGLSLGSLVPPGTTPQDKLLLVCGRHPWSCHPGAPIM